MSRYVHHGSSAGCHTDPGEPLRWCLHGGPGTGYAGSHGDTSYAAAFIIRTVPMLSQELELLSWWTFSDVFDEGWLTGVPFYGGYGLLNTQGVAKPAFRAFELLNGAGSRRLRGVTVHGDSITPKVAVVNEAGRLFEPDSDSGALCTHG